MTQTKPRVKPSAVARKCRLRRPAGRGCRPWTSSTLSWRGWCPRGCNLCLFSRANSSNADRGGKSVAGTLPCQGGARPHSSRNRAVTNLSKCRPPPAKSFKRGHFLWSIASLPKSRRSFQHLFTLAASLPPSQILCSPLHHLPQDERCHHRLQERQDMPLIPPRRRLGCYMGTSRAPPLDMQTQV